MLSPTPLRALRIAVPRLRGRRFASHEAPQYNEPSGWLFGEKVCTPYSARSDGTNIYWSHHKLAKSGSKRIGKTSGISGCLGRWHLLPSCCIINLIQGVFSICNRNTFQTRDDSIQTWALKEAKERMEARGEKYQYEPSSSRSWLSRLWIDHSII
jgi:hypothetical protein